MIFVWQWIVLEQYIQENKLDNFVDYYKLNIQLDMQNMHLHSNKIQHNRQYKY